MAANRYKRPYKVSPWLSQSEKDIIDAAAKAARKSIHAFCRDAILEVAQKQKAA
ncbi:MAG: hypothetical protein HC857_01155 [Synechococcales cyanobacterium RU_4_20]|nr:hypothetical protein [Synechococcales cyanobacterium RU_4_20]NJR71138.1 hypothetical protein [Synechococcales cyanobacterium CRU_2_2]